MKKRFYQLFMLLGALLAFGSQQATAQTYTCQGHTFGCQYPTNSRRYAAINKLDILLDGVVVYSKTPDNCNDNARGGHYNVMSTKPSFELFAGGTYEVRWNITNPGGYNGYQNYFLAYLDLNADGDYADTDEWISKSWGNVTYSSITTHSKKFSLPCTGINTATSRIRFRTDYQYGNLRNAANNHSNGAYYGETEEFTIRLVNPTSIVSKFNFVKSDTVYVGTPISAINKGNGSKTEWDLGNDGSIDYVGNNYTGLDVSTPGTYCIKQRASNCVGVDSSTKCYTVINPPAPTVPDFVASKTVGQLYDNIQFFDLSSYGPTEWDWFIYDSSQNPPVEYTSSDQNPDLNFYNTGTFTVCLRTKNLFGWSSWNCKKDYITITPFLEYDVSSAWGVPITERKGIMYDKGGTTGNYESNASKFTNFLTVIPCNAGDIKITFSQFKMADDNDKIFIFDGTNINGVPLHPAGGFKKSDYQSKVPFSVTAESGAFFIYYESNGSGQDSGFIASWEAEEGNGLGPVADWVAEYDTFYVNVPANIKNISKNTDGLTDYTWLADNVVNTSKDLTQTFTTDAVYLVCLSVKTCLDADTSTKAIDGDTICKNIVVVTPMSKANIDFEVNNRRPKIDEVVTFETTNDKANYFEWEVYPNNINYENGTDKNSMEPQMSFTKPGCYTVTLTAYNTVNSSVTKRTVVKDYYICIVGYCLPEADFTTSDISISNVKLSDGTTNVINNNSGAEVGGYADYSETVGGTVTFGKEYTITMSRSTNVDDWNGRVWIDWNVDGDFDDAGEEVLTEGSSSGSSFSATFNVPDYMNAFEGKSRMRVACGYKSKAPTSCASMRIGEFEDYYLNIESDDDVPVVVLTKPDTFVMQVNPLFPGTKLYVEPGYKGLDKTEGDVTNNVVVVSELEENVVGFYKITYNVCDNSGNCATEVVRYVKVVNDLTAPTITLANSVVNVAVSEKRACLGTLNTYTFDYASIGATAVDPEDGNLTNLIQYDANAVNMAVVGSYQVVFTVNDVQGNKDRKVATVNVQDLTAPDIVKDGPDNLSIGGIWADQTWACDKYDENPTLEVIPGVNGMPNTNIRGDYPVTYIARDASGNVTANIVRDYRVDDFTDPVIDLHTFDTVYHDVNNKYYSVHPSATDNFTKGLNVVRTSAPVDYHVLGVYMEVFETTDEAGNTATKTRYVHVVDREAPQISGTTITVPVGYEFWHQKGLVITDNYYNPVDLRKNLEIVSSNVNVWVPGTYNISYRITDPSGNQSAIFNRIVNVGYDFEANVGINDISLNENINVYPVPSNGIVNIEINIAPNTEVTGVVVNALGKVVSDLGSLKAGVSTIDLANHATGVYFVRFTSGEQTTVKRIVLN